MPIEASAPATYSGLGAVRIARNDNPSGAALRENQVILAVAAVLLHFPAVPQSSLPNISFAAWTIESASTEPTLGEPVMGLSPASPLVNAIALEPGRLTPSPIAPVSGAPAPAALSSPSSSSAAAAFIASSPAAMRAREQEQLRKHLWLGLSIADHSAATFDAWTTRRVISSGEGYEMDPLVRPFAGNASLYAAMQVGPLVLEYVGWRMMKSRHGWERRTWWVPQSLCAAMNLASGVHNLGVH
jgi:hypothetical protein